MTNQTKTHWRNFFPSDYLKAHEVQGEPVLTISKLTQEGVVGEKGQKDLCLICYWKEKGFKKLILGVKTCKVLEEITGSPNVEDWIGQRVKLYPTTDKSKGKNIDVVRIRNMKQEPTEKDYYENDVRIALETYSGS